MAAVLKTSDDTTQIVRPFRITGFLGLRQVQDSGFISQRCAYTRLGCAIGASGDYHVAVDGKGHHEAIAIVNVLANEVNSAR